jgi:hypothetical protein
MLEQANCRLGERLRLPADNYAHSFRDTRQTERMAQDNSPLGKLRRQLRRRRVAEQQLRERVRAQHIDSVSRLAHLSDAELIATAPGLANETHQMGAEPAPQGRDPGAHS